MKQFLLLLILFASLNHSIANAQNNNVNEQISLVENGLVGAVHSQDFNGWKIQDRMAHYKVNGISIAVIHNYKVEWAKGYGLADVATQTLVTTKTRFQAGSISKSINAIGVLKLAEKGSISLDSDINKYLTSWKFPYSPLSQGRNITIANLLSHTAGLNVSGFSGYAINSLIPSTIQILEGKSPANSPAVHSLFQSGLRYEYSGGGTTITQLIIEDVTYQSYGNYMQNAVLNPLGMSNSAFVIPGKENDTVVRAAGYYENGKQVEGKFHIYPEKAAAGLWTTPFDLANYIIGIQQACHGATDKILSPSMAKLMLMPYIDQRAGLGVFIDDYDGEKYFEHDGLTYGFYSQYYGSLTNGNGVVIMINSVNNGIVPEIINSVAKVYNFKGLYRSKVEKSVQIEESVLESYTGRYNLAPGVILTVSKEGKQLFVKLTGQDKIAIYPETENKFYLKVVDAQLEFVSDVNGKITKAVLYQNGSANDATKSQ